MIDKIVFGWIYDTCKSVGEFFYCGAFEGGVFIVMLFLYAVTIAKKEGETK